jgi:hypothetical protein
MEWCARSKVVVAEVLKIHFFSDIKLRHWMSISILFEPEVEGTQFAVDFDSCLRWNQKPTVHTV